MIKKVLLIVFPLFITINAQSQGRLNYENYELVFEENFDSITNTDQLNDVWQFVHDDPAWGWGDYLDTVTNIRTYGEYYSQSQVSIQPGGILRLTAEKLEDSISIWSDWYNTYRTPKYKSGMIQLKTSLSASPFDVKKGISGFLYGMFEIRVRLPPSIECFPAFWLIRAGYPTEIDIFEYGGNNRIISNNVIDIKKKEGNKGNQFFYKKSMGKNLSKDFHKISCVWTPSKVSFFLDGKELRTVDSSEQKTHNAIPLTIIVNLAMNPWHSIESNYMDIDYIRVYKPKFGDYNQSYIKNVTGLRNSIRNLFNWKK